MQTCLNWKLLSASSVVVLLSVYSAHPTLAQTVPLEAAKQKLAEGQKAFDSGKFDEALAAYSESVKIAPQYDQAYYRRAILLYQQQRRAEAIADFSKVIELDPKNADAYYRRGLGHISLGGQENYDKFFADEGKAIELNPDFLFAYKFRALTYVSIGKFDAAIADYNQVIRLEPGSAVNYLNRATAYYDKRNPESFEMALKDLAQAALLDPKNVPVYALRAQTYSQLGNRVAALADCDKVAALRPEGPDSFTWRGTVFFNLKEYLGAAQAYEQAIAVTPKNSLSHLFAGVAYALSHQDDKAVPLLNAGIALGTKEDARRVLRFLEYTTKKDPGSQVSDRVLDLLRKAVM
ncbi:MAG: tetratricopeptide repeat protein [Armatimonadota bacterium]